MLLFKDYLAYYFECKNDHKNNYIKGVKVKLSKNSRLNCTERPWPCGEGETLQMAKKCTRCYKTAGREAITQVLTAF